MTRNMIIGIWLTAFLHPVIFSVCFTHSKGDRKMVGQEDGTVARRAAPEDRRKI